MPRGLRYLLIVLFALSAAPSGTAESGPTISITGIDGEALDNVRAYLRIDKDGHAPKLSGDEWQAWQGKAETRIREALQAIGYYEPAITAGKDDKGNPRYRIDKGPAVHIGTRDIQILGDGQSDPDFQKLIDKSPVKPKARFHHGRYEDLKGDLEDLAQEHGYFQAKFQKSEVRLSAKDRRADITLIYDTGKRYHFGAVTFGDNPLSDERLRELVTFKPGEPFERKKLERLQRRLEGSNYFEQVVLDAEPGKADASHTIPVDVTLKPKKRWLYEFGAGYGTDTGARFLLGAENRIANSDGHSYGVRLAPSERRSEYTSYYDIPLNQLRGDRLRFEASFIQTDDDLGTSDVMLTKAEREMRLDDAWFGHNLRFAYFLQVQKEDYQLIGEPERSSFLVIPGARLSARRANDPLYPTDGYRWQILAQGAEQNLASDITFVQTRVDAKWLHSFFDKQRLIVRGNAGYTAIASEDLDDLPTSLRFAAGGDQSVRGYDYNSLGPRNEADENLGGRYLLVGSAEYDYRFKDKWLVAGFIDTGNAFNDLNGYTLKTGVGFGIRWLSPVGPIRLDLAHALDEGGKNFRIHFSMGPEL